MNLFVPSIVPLVVSIVFLSIGLLSCLTLLFPALRGIFGWGNGVRCGRVSRLGFAGLFGCTGLLTCLDLYNTVGAICGTVLLFAIPTILIGNWIDHRDIREKIEGESQKEIPNL
jgi:hypothetical protein